MSLKSRQPSRHVVALILVRPAIEVIAARGPLRCRIVAGHGVTCSYATALTQPPCSRSRQAAGAPVAGELARAILDPWVEWQRSTRKSMTARVLARTLASCPTSQLLSEAVQHPWRQTSAAGASVVSVHAVQRHYGDENAVCASGLPFLLPAPAPRSSSLICLL